MLTSNLFKAAKCPECGADIQVPSDRDQVKCMFCGKDIIVRQAIQASAGPNVQNWVRLAAAAEEADNHDEAYDYYTRVLEVEPENHEAWFGKAVAAGWGSNLSRSRYPELLAGIERAIQYAPDAKKEEMRKRGADIASDITVAYYKLSVGHTSEYIALDDTWAEHIERCLPMLSVLEVANTLDPTNKQVVENGIYLAKSLIEGVQYSDPYDTYDSGAPKTKTKHLPEKLEAQVQQTMDEFVAKMKAMDTAYEAPKIKKAGEMGIFGCLGAAIVLGLMGWGGWWVIKALFFNH
ncbi:MAG: tetratricopeptide repeat protein [Polyangiaceae bacterium]